MKDNFSKDSHLYAKYRPTYPSALFTYIFSLLETKDHAWDCATGNGQVATQLAKEFQVVEATDISALQLEQAPKLAHIHYSIQAAEQTKFEKDQFDLITVAQAIHWFDFEKFYAEVNRTLKPNGILAVMGYGLLSISPEIDLIIHHFYNNIIGEYWDEERKYIEENYATIPFSFEEIKTPKFEITYEWTAENLLNYLYTWSAVKHYEKDKNESPLLLIQQQLKETWGAKKRKVTFPVLLRVGKKKSFSA
ncbi:class I SAM-dependent methyltransferase [Mesonia sp.]|uniref:class I SAM-dependent methyltransferase n=1 Tax=Mesonia sp. TaxID=1960830 RepID=UPI001766DBA8|nr:class I SAM-dependent methyltransferase [Mesonia sp.]HIB36391.1 class I SAM-dependent methyltransferase [Mesonia sp.]HIO28060.1 class I SAM-dependent methyltransferase [Flavobacteriaceae bacterium]